MDLSTKFLELLKRFRQADVRIKKAAELYKKSEYRFIESEAQFIDYLEKYQDEHLKRLQSQDCWADCPPEVREDCPGKVCCTRHSK